MNDKINELVRDFTKVGPMPKSEARRRLVEFEKLIREDENKTKRIEDGLYKIEYIDNGFNAKITKI